VPAGASCCRTARVGFSVETVLKPWLPGGKISANVVCRSGETYIESCVVKKSL